MLRKKRATGLCGVAPFSNAAIGDARMPVAGGMEPRRARWLSNRLKLPLISLGSCRRN